MLNVALNLERNADLAPDAPAIHFLGKTLTYAQLNAASNQVANGLRRLGIGAGDRVVLACPNTPQFPIVYYGILKAGGVVIPINILLKAPEIAYCIKDCDAKAFFCFEGNVALPLGEHGYAGFLEAGSCRHFIMMTADLTKPGPIKGAQTLASFMHEEFATTDCTQRQADDTAIILYTSGTTGKPKGAELSHSNIATNALACALLFQSTREDVHLVTLPLFHSFGQTAQMNSAILLGASLVLAPRFDPDNALELMQTYGVTVFAGVPTMYIGLLNLPGAAERYNLPAIASRLRVGISGGASMPVEVIRQFEERFGIPILEGYGLSETSPVVTFTAPGDERIPGSVGKAIYGTQVRIIDDKGVSLPRGELGEIVVRGHNVMKGYYNRPDASHEVLVDGWFHTGDIGKQDERGNLFIVDRLKEMIIRGGFNVYPREIEEVLMAHPNIAEVAVVGVPHESHGEEIKAVLVLQRGCTATPTEIIAWCKERLAAYKYPRIVEVVESLPRTATGKILKRALQ